MKLLLVLMIALLSLSTTNGSWIGNSNGATHHGALSMQEGSKQNALWSTTLKHATPCPEAFSASNEKIFIAQASTISTFEIATGKSLWSKQVAPDEQMITAPVTSYGDLLLVAAEKCIYAVTEQNGGPVWKYCSELGTTTESETQHRLQPEVAEELNLAVSILFDDKRHTLEVVDTLEGSLVWSTTQLYDLPRTSDSKASSPKLAVHSISERIYTTWVRYGSNEKAVITCSNLRTGELVYEYTIEGSTVSVASIDIQGFLYVVTDKEIISLDESGKKRWSSRPTDYQPLTSHPIVLNEQDQVLYILASSALWIIDMRNGELLGKFSQEIQFQGTESQILSFNPSTRRLFIAGPVFKVYRVQLDGVPVLQKKLSLSYSHTKKMHPNALITDTRNMYFVSTAAGPKRKACRMEAYAYIDDLPEPPTL